MWLEVANGDDLFVRLSVRCSGNDAIKDDTDELRELAIEAPMDLAGRIAVDAKHSGDLNPESGLFVELSLGAPLPGLAGFQMATGQSP